MINILLNISFLREDIITIYGYTIDALFLRYLVIYLLKIPIKNAIKEEKQNFIFNENPGILRILFFFICVNNVLTCIY